MNLLVCASFKNVLAHSDAQALPAQSVRASSVAELNGLARHIFRKQQPPVRAFDKFRIMKMKGHVSARSRKNGGLSNLAAELKAHATIARKLRQPKRAPESAAF